MSCPGLIVQLRFLPDRVICLKSLEQGEGKSHHQEKIHVACSIETSLQSLCSVLFWMLTWLPDKTSIFTCDCWLCRDLWTLLTSLCWIPACASARCCISGFQLLWLFLFLFSPQTWEKKCPTLLTHWAQSSPCIPEIGLLSEALGATQQSWVWFSSVEPFKIADFLFLAVCSAPAPRWFP